MLEISNNSSPSSKKIHRTHNFIEIVFLIMCAIISGAECSADIHLFGKTHLDWIKKYLPFKKGIPKSNVISFVIRRLSPYQFNEIFINYINEIRKYEGKKLIPINRRILRHMFEDETQTSLHSINLWNNGRRLIFSQYKSICKRNEQAGVLEVLDSLVLKNAIISVNSTNTQKKIAEKITEQKANYVIALNQNHGVFLNTIRSYFHKISRDNPSEIEEFEEFNIAQNYVDTYCYRKLKISNWLKEAKQWAGIKSVIEVEYKRSIKGTKIQEKFYYISSLDTDIETLSKTIHQNLAMKNQMHWVLDIAYKEDKRTTNQSKNINNIVALRRLAFYLSHLHPEQISFRRKLKLAGWSNSYREKLLFGEE